MSTDIAGAPDTIWDFYLYNCLSPTLIQEHKYLVTVLCQGTQVNLEVVTHVWWNDSVGQGWCGFGIAKMALHMQKWERTKSHKYYFGADVWQIGQTENNVIGLVVQDKLVGHVSSISELFAGGFDAHDKCLKYVGITSLLSCPKFHQETD